MIATGAQMLRWQVYTAAFGGVVLLLTVLFQATGKIIPSFLLSISRQGVAFVAALLVCVKLFAYNGVLMGQAVADVVSALIALVLLACANPMGQERSKAHKGRSPLFKYVLKKADFVCLESMYQKFSPHSPLAPENWTSRCPLGWPMYDLDAFRRCSISTISAWSC